MARLTRSKCLPTQLWPVADREAWQAALQPSDVFEPGGAASRWAAATRRKTASGYGHFLLWLRERNELDEGVGPTARVTRERVAAYLAELKRTNRGHTIQCRIQALGDAMRALVPDREWRWILRAAGRLRAATVPARDKRPRLRPIGDLVAQGFRMMEETDRQNELSGLGRAALYRDALLIAFLGFHPLRLRNLASLRIGHELLEEGGAYTLKLAASETKGHQPYEAVLGARLSLALKKYLRHHRPVLLRAKGRWHVPATDELWISRDGSPCREQTFVNIIRKHTRGPDGRPLSPHLFRTCAATSVAVEAPGSVGIIPAVLGHGSPKTGERYYNLAGSLEASRAHAAVLEALRRDLGHGLRDLDQRNERPRHNDQRSRQQHR